MGIAGAVIGWLSGAPLAAGGLLGALASGWFIWRVPRPQPGFDAAFGSGWQQHSSAEQQAHTLKHRWSLFPGLGNPRQPCLEQNLVLATIPGTERQLLCDIWQPPAGVAPSGVALVYLHGSSG